MKALTGIAIMAVGVFIVVASPVPPTPTANAEAAMSYHRREEPPTQSNIYRQSHRMELADRCQRDYETCYPVENCCPGLECKFDRSGTRRKCFPPGEGED